MKLINPPGYESLTDAQIADVSNGCGPKGWGQWVPDRFRLIGINFKPACDRHDFDYEIGTPKKEADNRFLDNMTIIANEAPWPCKQVAHVLAFSYYLAVKNGGKGAYNRAKEE
jgi:hypothetical protein